MRTAVILDERFKLHDTGQRHPERPARLDAVHNALESSGLLQQTQTLPFTAANAQAPMQLHGSAYVERLADACRSGHPYLDSVDCALCPATYDTALLAVGAVTAAVDAVLDHRVDRVFCAVRPPGHHAERIQSMGFCFFNNVALAAEHAIKAHHLQRVAIVDFDVHHGNGTQHLFEHRDDVLFISLHEHPRFLYPGTGYAHETGEGHGRGYTLNVPLPPHSDDEAYIEAVRTLIVPRLKQYQPQLLLFSAGFDAAADDPLGHMELTDEAFARITTEVCAASGAMSDGRVVSVLEGGYDLQALGAGVVAHVRALMQA